MKNNKPFGWNQNRNINYFLTCNFISSMRVPAALLVQYWCVFYLCPKLQIPLVIFPHLLTSFHCWHFEVVHSHLAPRILPQLREYKTTKKQVRIQESNIQAGKKKCLKTTNQSATWNTLIIFLFLSINLESPNKEKTFPCAEKIKAK